MQLCSAKQIYCQLRFPLVHFCGDAHASVMVPDLNQVNVTVFKMVLLLITCYTSFCFKFFLGEVDSTVEYAYPQHWGHSELKQKYSELSMMIFSLPTSYFYQWNIPLLVTEINSPLYLGVSYLHLFSLFFFGLLTSMFSLDLKRE